MRGHYPERKTGRASVVVLSTAAERREQITSGIDRNELHLWQQFTNSSKIIPIKSKESEMMKPQASLLKSGYSEKYLLYA